jgi:hypothetical protein
MNEAVPSSIDADEMAKLLAQRECERLIIAYARYIDLGEATRVGALFAEDAVWRSLRSESRGREAIVARFARRERQTRLRSLHVCTNISIDVVSPTEAVGVTYYQLFRANAPSDGFPPPLRSLKMLGIYRDRFVRREGAWRFAERLVDVVFAVPESQARRTPQGI